MKRVAVYICTLLILSSCKKERSADAFVPYPATDTTWVVPATGRFIHPIDTLFPQKPSETGIVSNYKYDTAHFSNNTVVCTSPGFALMNNGSTVQGDVKIELLQLSKKGDFIKYGKPTISTDGLLDRQVVFRIKLSNKNAEPVLFNEKASMSVRYRTNYISGHTSVYHADTTLSSSVFSWEETPDGARPFEETDNQQSVYGYDIPCRKLGWLSCGKSIQSSAGENLTVILPVSCTNLNTVVYAVFKNQTTVVRLSADVPGKFFFTNAIPAGTELQLITVTKTPLKLMVGAAYFTLKKNGIILKMKPEIVSRQQASDFLDGI